MYKKSLQKKKLNELQFCNSDCIIIDKGTRYYKVGYAGEDKPRFSVSSCEMKNHVSGKYIFGDDCFNSSESKTTEHSKLQWETVPEIKEEEEMIYRSKFEEDNRKINFGAFERLINYIFKTKLNLEYSNESNPMVIAETCNKGEGENDYKQKERITMSEILFETFKVPKLFFGYQPVFAMYSQGTTTGLSVDIGDTYTQIVPVFNGFDLKHAIIKENFGGSELTGYMNQLIQETYQKKKEKPINFHSVEGFRYIELCKEKMCGIKTSKTTKEEEDTIKSYVLPDRNVVKLKTSDCQKVGEILFKPSMLKENKTKETKRKFPKGLHKMIYKSYKKCDELMQSEIAENIILSGGSTLFSGIKDRLEAELSNLDDMIWKIKDPEEREVNAWIGASMFTSLSTASSLFTKKTEYEENRDRIFI